MSYPSPTIYTYRVVQVLARQQPGGYWLTEYSADAGSTWNPLHSHTFQSYNDAENAIAFVVGSEANFQAVVNGEQGPSQLNPRRYNLAYPPT